ncbi:zinc finger protein-like 1 homolog isoform X2 [Orbicella faveolata]|uniref:zinc finger protein-like 1 homolog isoform X2 n=1 Tax=Orbicella faveolata TaxID=48498 RepID=UPI0009E25DC1|nr:zinc finger protein-like 1 homolog isoform X2 [Orbicella faveolata]
MGLCKCPKKKVTTQFCFEHRVNVCEHCLVSNHPKCIVKSYLHWLQDSDYNPVCTLCNGSLAEGDVVRLICFDVFHWGCLNSYAASLPTNTAPAGYTCPNCKSPVFPPEKQVSPVADQLRQMLASAPWARVGLGLPVVPASSSSSSAVSESSVSRHEADVGTVSRKIFNTREAVDSIPYDHDENKYQRRGAIDWFTRWFWSRRPKKPGPEDPNASLKRTTVMLILLVLAFTTIVVLFTRVGRGMADKDPFLDPMANPNIRVRGGKMDNA